MLDFALMKNIVPALMQGALVTLEITIVAWAIGFILGTVLGCLHVYGFKPLQWFISIYVTLIRGTPMLIQITFFYFVLPLFGIMLSNFWTAIIAIGINSSAYISQIVVAGIKSVSIGQVEAAKVLGFSPVGIMHFIVLPQAIRVTIPALAGECITLVKDSSLASIVGVMELYKEARSIINQSYDVITIFCLVAGLYLIMTSSVSLIFHCIERKMDWYVKSK
jgi:His/Glu/Gln/Arg/opine family amino acid ABC transporter permease subunit